MKIKIDFLLTIRNNWEKIAIFFLIIIVYNQWIFRLGYLEAGDWVFHNRISLLEFYRVPQLWFSMWNFGSINIMPTFSVSQFVYGSLAHFFDFAVLERVVYFWTILIFSYIGILKLGKMIFQEDKIGRLFFALLFLFNTYILSIQTGFTTYANVYALSPLVFYLFIKLLNEKPNLKNVLSSSFVLLLCSFYEPRGLVALSYFLVLYLIYVLLTAKTSRVGILLGFISTYAILIVFNLYWIFPQFFITSIGDIPSLNSLFVPFNSFLDSFSFHSYAWQGNIFENFRMVAFHKIIPSSYFFIVTTLTFSASLFYKKLRRSDLVLFLLVSSLIGVFLLKQQNEPFGFIYEWLFHNLPTFNLFRESNKFVVFFLPISLLFGYSVSYLASRIKTQSIKIIFLLLVSSLVLLNTKPLINQQIQTLFVNRYMPDDYTVLNNFITNQPEYFRTIFVPRSSNWAVYSNLHPRTSAVDVIQAQWGDLAEYKQKDNNFSIQSQILDGLKRPFSDRLIDISSIKYIIVPLADKVSDDDFFPFYGGDRGSYISELDKIGWLQKIDLGTKEITAYENKDFRPHLYTTEEQESIYKNIPFNATDSRFITPTEYTMNLKNLSKPTYLNFSEKYSPDWRLRIGKFNWFNVLTDKNYFIDGKQHSENDAKLNSFLLDPEYIKNNFDKSYYKENPDGSVDVELTLYFKPQSYFYLGIIVSLVSISVAGVCLSRLYLLKAIYRKTKLGKS